MEDKRYTMACNEEEKNPSYFFLNKDMAEFVCNGCKHRQLGHCLREVVEIV